MSDTFELFRLSLLPRPQRDVFANQGADPSREEYLREVLAEKYLFKHYGRDFHYVPAAEYSSQNAILGRIGRKLESEENMPPEEGLEEIVHEAWKAAVVVVDPTHHKDGQKASVQFDRKIGKPFSLLSSLAGAINQKNTTAAYSIEVQPIFDADTFWDFAKKNKGNVTWIKFNFVVPNMFGTSDNLSKELKGFGEHENAQKVEMAITSADGLDPETERVEASVDYAQRGGGSVHARAKGGKKYSSTSKTKKISLSDTDGPKESLLKRASRKLSRVFGRE